MRTALGYLRGVAPAAVLVAHAGDEFVSAATVEEGERAEGGRGTSLEEGETPLLPFGVPPPKGPASAAEPGDSRAGLALRLPPPPVLNGARNERPEGALEPGLRPRAPSGVAGRPQLLPGREVGPAAPGEVV